MKKVYVNEKWCLGCHLCEYYCAFAGTEEKDMARALKDIKINPKIKIEERDGVSFAVSCRHCREPLCVKGCITGALTIADERSETSAPDIYAAGDCTQTLDVSSGQNRIMAILPNAYMQGDCAGINMAGGNKVFDKAIPMNAIDFGLICEKPGLMAFTKEDRTVKLGEAR